jgi:hypothetical protein
MLGDIIRVPYILSKEYENDPWFIKAKKYLILEHENDPNDNDVLILLLVCSTSPSEFLYYFKKIIEVGPSLMPSVLQREIKLVDALEWEDNSSKRDHIAAALYRLLRENVISEMSDKKVAEETIKIMYAPYKNNRDYMLFYWELLFYCRSTEAGKITCIEEMFKIDHHNAKAIELNKMIGHKVPLILEKCEMCGCYTNNLREGLCDNCYRQVDHSWYGDAMDTYKELSDPFDEGIDMFED